MYSEHGYSTSIVPVRVQHRHVVRIVLTLESTGTSIATHEWLTWLQKVANKFRVTLARADSYSSHIDYLFIHKIVKVKHIGVCTVGYHGDWVLLQRGCQTGL